MAQGKSSNKKGGKGKNKTDGKCGACGQPLTGRTVEALENAYHASCFKCTICRRDLIGVKFNVNGTKLYCDIHYASEFAPKCAKCGKHIRERLVIALGKKWHAEHFRCAKCETELGGTFFVEKEDNVYCEHCYHKIFSPKCAACKAPILDVAVIAMDQMWHTGCFKCKICGEVIKNTEYSVIKGEAVCKACVKKCCPP